VDGVHAIILLEDGVFASRLCIANVYYYVLLPKKRIYIFDRIYLACILSVIYIYKIAISVRYKATYIMLWQLRTII